MSASAITASLLCARSRICKDSRGRPHQNSNASAQHCGEWMWNSGRCGIDRGVGRGSVCGAGGGVARVVGRGVARPSVLCHPPEELAAPVRESAALLAVDGPPGLVVVKVVQSHQAVPALDAYRSLCITFACSNPLALSNSALALHVHHNRTATPRGQRKVRTRRCTTRRNRSDGMESEVRRTRAHAALPCARSCRPVRAPPRPPKCPL